MAGYSPPAVNAQAIASPPNTIVWMGDSIEANAGGSGPHIATSTLHCRGYVNWANVLLGHRLTVLSNAGQGGDTTAGMLARFKADVINLRPGWVLIKGGTNDVAADATFATITANLAAMYALAKHAGVRVIAVPITPRGLALDITTAQRNVLVDVNRWIREQCANDSWLVLADVGQATVDPATTWNRANGMTVDGLHFAAPGAAAAGRLLAAKLDPIIPRVDLLWTGSNGDAANLLPHGVFDGAGAALPTSWSVLAGSGVGTISYVARTDGIAGNWMQVVVPNGDKYGVQNNIALSAAMAIGDTVEFLVDVQCSNLDPAPAANTQAFIALLKAWNGSAFTTIMADCYWDTLLENVSFPGAGGVFRTSPLTIPGGTTLVVPTIQMFGGGTYRVGRGLLRKVV